MSSNEQQRVGRRTFLKGVAGATVGLSLAGGFAPPLLADDEPAATTDERVKVRTLGATGLPVSSMVYGGGGLRGESSRILQAAYDRGMTTIDVAWGYGQGQAEEGVGSFLKDFPHRDKVQVFTKGSGFRKPQGSARAVLAGLEADLAKSLKRMQTEYVDLFMWPHGATTPASLRDEAMHEAMTKLKEKGLIRHIGFSSHANYVETCTAGIEDGFYEAILTVVNVCTQNADRAGTPEPGRRQRGRSMEDTRALAQLAKARNVGLLAMKVANPGFLTPKTDELLAEAFPEESTWSRHQKLYSYGLGVEGVSAVLVGIRNVTHLREAVTVGAA